MPELPEIQAHAERLDAALAGTPLERFTALAFTALKTATPAPEGACGQALTSVGSRGKHLLLAFGDLTFVVPSDMAPPEALVRAVRVEIGV